MKLESSHQVTIESLHLKVDEDGNLILPQKKILLDANPIIFMMWYKKEKYGEDVLDIFDEENIVWINNIIYDEVLGVLLNKSPYDGMYKDKEETKKAINKFLKENKIQLDDNPNIGKNNIQLVRSKAKKTKSRAGEIDKFILAYCLSNDIEIVYSNDREFRKLATFLGLNARNFESNEDKLNKKLKSAFRK